MTTEHTAATGRGFAHAKAILLGEHAVVYGSPAVALPVPSLRVEASARHVAGASVLDTEISLGPLDPADPLGTTVLETLRHVGAEDDGVEVVVRGTLPIGRGLGSSAAAANAIVDAVADLYGVALDDADRFELVQRGERVAHGTPSGLDARATSASAPILFTAGRVDHPPIRFGGGFVVADTGARGSTRKAVADVRAFIERNPARGRTLLAELEHGTLAGIADLAADRRDDLGTRMTAAQLVLDELGAGHPAITALIEVARAAGALGAKLTGGGQGGCIIALARDAASAERISQALLEAGALGTWTIDAEDYA
ncbi:mevalonate kinase [Plantibacter sp. VKM Ac-2880]|uniref:mevalonate kinase n=1 Tax=Plantibacter sp. VKM Ac-2880 TaxID=2783827 RepID=UPI00188FE1B9|nr:mevalonate kinase [Plantibacter sp. VKM Ac-2880]MBF4569861.1 mevalonate kinase [Plantibacter sp. VKM Ac-2880]